MGYLLTLLGLLAVVMFVEICRSEWRRQYSRGYVRGYEAARSNMLRGIELAARGVDQGQDWPPKWP